MTSDEPLKTCARCKRAKPRFSGYRRHAGYGDGWESRCKSCQRETERLRKLQKKSGAGHEPSAAELLELAEGESLYAKRVIKALTDANKAVAALLVAIADVPGSGAGAR